MYVCCWVSQCFLILLHDALPTVYVLRRFERICVCLAGFGKVWDSLGELGWVWEGVGWFDMVISYICIRALRLQEHLVSMQLVFVYIHICSKHYRNATLDSW